MKRNIINKIAAFCFVPMLAASCNFLDIDPVDTFSEETVFGNLETINGYVMKRYSEMWDPFDRYALRYACDEAVNNFDWGGQTGILRGYMSPDYDAGLGTWYQYYYNIQQCNLFMDNIPTMEVLMTDKATTDQVNAYIAEIKFLRAFYYADLISRYGDVVLSKTAFRLDMTQDELLLPRTPYDEVVSFIVEELDDAAKYLPMKYDDDMFGRATKGAALALKARVLLYAASPLHNPNNDQSKWLAAKEATEDIIFLNTDGTSDENSGTKMYSLDPSYEQLFHNAQSSEIIFEKLFSSEFGHMMDQYNSPNGFTGWSETCVNDDLVNAYEIAATGELPDPDELYTTVVNGEVLPYREYEEGTSPWDGRDPRFYVTIGCDGQEWKTREIEYWLTYKSNDKFSGNTYEFKVVGGGKDSAKGGIEEWNASDTGFYLRKYMTPSLGVSYNDKSNVPYIYFRLGEFYLNYAEILYMLGDEDGAKRYIEKIRERARGGDPDILPEITATGNELWEKYMHERRIELAFEEHRFFDIRRWKNAETEQRDIYGVNIFREIKCDDSGNPIMENGALVYGKKSYQRTLVLDCQFSAPKHYLFAVPNSERQKNSKLSQNEGY